MTGKHRAPDEPEQPICGATQSRHGHVFTCTMRGIHMDHAGGSPGVRGIIWWPNPEGVR